MKIRLMGSPDLVRAWKQALEQSYGISGAEYPSRRGGNELRVYFDLDDRVAMETVIAFQSAQNIRAAKAAAGEAVAVTRRGRKAIKKAEGG